MNYRRLALLFGVGALGVGLVAIAYPELVAFSLDRILVSIVGVLALVQALRVIQTRRHSELDEAVTPDPELPFATPAPGEELETVLEGFLDTRQTLYHQNRVRDGLRSAAAAVLTQYGGYSESDAEAALEAGTWTDDRFAAAFLGGENVPTLPARDRLQRWIRRESPLQRDARHTVDAIAAKAGLEPPSGEDSNKPSRGHRIRREGVRNDTSPNTVTTTNEDPDDDAGDVISRASHPTGHWKGVSVVALVGIGIGLLVEEPAVLLAGVVGIGFAAYARSSVLPPGSVSVNRSLDENLPEMGDDVEVTVTVTNETDRFLPDLRLVDGVPESLAVGAGSPRLGTALGPGETTTFSYTITARRGVHPFGPTLLVARDLSTSLEEVRLLSEETTLTCIPSLRALTESVPLREQATQYVGRVETSDGGDGIEFYATRDYRRGDPLSRIDWNRQARTGELTTVEFREERAATVVLVVDAREAAYISPDPHSPHAVERAVDAAGQLYSTLTDAGDQVGITALSPKECWLAPGAGVDHGVEARELLATHPAFSPVPQERGSGMIRWRRQLRKRLPPGTQIVFLTPLCDEYGSRSARRLDEYGYPVTVLSPDPTTDRTASHRLSRVARMLRISAVRSAGIPVIDWPQDATVDEALARYNERWTQ